MKYWYFWNIFKYI